MQTNSAAQSAAFGVGTSLNYPVQALNLLQVQQQQQQNQQQILNQQNMLQSQQQQSQQKDTTFTKIFVGGLPYHTTDESLKQFFQRFGNIEEAVVITDRSTGKSRGYGFVTMETREAAEAAVLDPNPIIDGRKANVNLAYLGVKSRIVQPTNIIPLTLARYPIPATTATYGIHPFTYYHQIASPAAQQTFQLATGSTNLLLPAHPAAGLTANSTFSPLASTANNGLFDLSTATYNSHIAAATALNPNRTSPFDTANHLTAVTNTNQFLPFNAASLTNSNPANSNSLNSVLTAASANQSTGSYFALTPQHLTATFQSQ